MKNIKDYVCTLDQSKKIKKFGIQSDEDSLFCWSKIINRYQIILRDRSEDDSYRKGVIAAFTSQELIELINSKISTKDALNLFPIDFGNPKTLADALIEILEKGEKNND